MVMKEGRLRDQEGGRGGVEGAEGAKGSTGG